MDGSEPAGAKFYDSLSRVMDEDELQAMSELQSRILLKYKKVNSKLANCNDVCGKLYQPNADRIKRHTQLLVQTKNDLDNIFQRLRTLKQSLEKQYPVEFMRSMQEYANAFDDEEEVSPQKLNIDTANSVEQPETSTNPMLEVTTNEYRATKTENAEG
eukprot:Colp12_sorted_trinity150504_noHs@12411